jgi:hypothetical protein
VCFVPTVTKKVVGVFGTFSVRLRDPWFHGLYDSVLSRFRSTVSHANT